MAGTLNLLAWRAVAAGAAVAVFVTVPFAVAGDAAGEASNLVIVFFLGTLGGFVAGGFVAARMAAAAPYSNSAVAATVGWALVQGASIVLALRRGDDLRPAAIAVNGLAAYACGLVGGLVAARTRTTGADHP